MSLPSPAVHPILTKMDQFLAGLHRVEYKENEDYIVVRSLRWHIGLAEASLDYFERHHATAKRIDPGCVGYARQIEVGRAWLEEANRLLTTYTVAQENPV